MIYDGDCAFCARCREWATKRMRSPIHWQPHQTIKDLNALGLTREDVTTKAHWVDEDGTVHSGHRAIARTLSHLKHPYPLLGRILTLPGINAASAFVYSRVSQHRHKMPGGSAACRIDDHKDAA